MTLYKRYPILTAQARRARVCQWNLSYWQEQAALEAQDGFRVCIASFHSGISIVQSPAIDADITTSSGAAVLSAARRRLSAMDSRR